MYNPYLPLADVLRILKRESQYPFRSCPGDQFNALYDTVDYDVFDPTVFSFSVFADKDGVDIVVGGLVAGDRHAGTDVGKKAECTAKSEVERDMAFPYWGLL